MKWSLGSTMTMASGSRRRMVMAAQPMHGAVLRGAGSDRKFASGSVGERCPHGVGQVPGGDHHHPLRRADGQDSPNAGRNEGLARLPARGRSCLGRALREAGQNRVPAPPAMMTA